MKASHTPFTIYSIFAKHELGISRYLLRGLKSGQTTKQEVEKMRVRFLTSIVYSISVGIFKVDVYSICANFKS